MGIILYLHVTINLDGDISFQQCTIYDESNEEVQEQDYHMSAEMMETIERNIWMYYSENDLPKYMEVIPPMTSEKNYYQVYVTVIPYHQFLLIGKKLIDKNHPTETIYLNASINSTKDDIVIIKQKDDDIELWEQIEDYVQHQLKEIYKERQLPMRNDMHVMRIMFAHYEIFVSI